MGIVGSDVNSMILLFGLVGTSRLFSAEGLEVVLPRDYECSREDITAMSLPKQNKNSSGYR